MSANKSEITSDRIRINGSEKVFKPMSIEFCKKILTVTSFVK